MSSFGPSPRVSPLSSGAQETEKENFPAATQVRPAGATREPTPVFTQADRKLSAMSAAQEGDELCVSIYVDREEEAQAASQALNGRQQRAPRARAGPRGLKPRCLPKMPCYPSSVKAGVTSSSPASRGGENGRESQGVTASLPLSAPNPAPPRGVLTPAAFLNGARAQKETDSPSSQSFEPRLRDSLSPSDGGAGGKENISAKAADASASAHGRAPHAVTAAGGGGGGVEAPAAGQEVQGVLQALRTQEEGRLAPPQPNTPAVSSLPTEGKSGGPSPADSASVREHVAAVLPLHLGREKQLTSPFAGDAKALSDAASARPPPEMPPPSAADPATGTVGGENFLLHAASEDPRPPEPSAEVAPGAREAATARETPSSAGGTNHEQAEPTGTQAPRQRGAFPVEEEEEDDDVPDLFMRATSTVARRRQGWPSHLSLQEKLRHLLAAAAAGGSFRRVLAGSFVSSALPSSTAAAPASPSSPSASPSAAPPPCDGAAVAHAPKPAKAKRRRSAAPKPRAPQFAEVADFSNSAAEAARPSGAEGEAFEARKRRREDSEGPGGRPLRHPEPNMDIPRSDFSAEASNALPIVEGGEEEADGGGARGDDDESGDGVEDEPRDVGNDICQPTACEPRRRAGGEVEEREEGDEDKCFSLEDCFDEYTSVSLAAVRRDADRIAKYQEALSVVPLGRRACSPRLSSLADLRRCRQSGPLSCRSQSSVRRLQGSAVASSLSPVPPPLHQLCDSSSHSPPHPFFGGRCSSLAPRRSPPPPPSSLLARSACAFSPSSFSSSAASSLGSACWGEAEAGVEALRARLQRRLESLRRKKTFLSHAVVFSEDTVLRLPLTLTSLGVQNIHLVAVDADAAEHAKRLAATFSVDSHIEVFSGLEALYTHWTDLRAKCFAFYLGEEDREEAAVCSVLPASPSAGGPPPSAFEASSPSARVPSAQTSPRSPSSASSSGGSSEEVEARAWRAWAMRRLVEEFWVYVHLHRYRVAVIDDGSHLAHIASAKGVELLSSFVRRNSCPSCTCILPRRVRTWVTLSCFPPPHLLLSAAATPSASLSLPGKLFPPPLSPPSAASSSSSSLVARDAPTRKEKAGRRGRSSPEPQALVEERQLQPADVSVPSGGAAASAFVSSAAHQASSLSCSPAQRLLFSPLLTAEALSLSNTWGLAENLCLRHAARRRAETPGATANKEVGLAEKGHVASPGEDCAVTKSSPSSTRHAHAALEGVREAQNWAEGGELQLSGAQRHGEREANAHPNAQGGGAAEDASPSTEGDDAERERVAAARTEEHALDASEDLVFHVEENNQLAGLLITTQVVLDQGVSFGSFRNTGPSSALEALSPALLLLQEEIPLHEGDIVSLRVRRTLGSVAPSEGDKEEGLGKRASDARLGVTEEPQAATPSARDDGEISPQDLQVAERSGGERRLEESGAAGASGAAKNAILERLTASSLQSAPSSASATPPPLASSLCTSSPHASFFERFSRALPALPAVPAPPASFASLRLTYEVSGSIRRAVPAELAAASPRSFSSLGGGRVAGASAAASTRSLGARDAHPLAQAPAAPAKSSSAAAAVAKGAGRPAASEDAFGVSVSLRHLHIKCSASEAAMSACSANGGVSAVVAVAADGLAIAAAAGASGRARRHSSRRRELEKALWPSLGGASSSLPSPGSPPSGPSVPSGAAASPAHASRARRRRDRAGAGKTGGGLDGEARKRAASERRAAEEIAAPPRRSRKMHAAACETQEENAAWRRRKETGPKEETATARIRSSSEKSGIQTQRASSRARSRGVNAQRNGESEDAPSSSAGSASSGRLSQASRERHASGASFRHAACDDDAPLSMSQSVSLLAAATWARPTLPPRSRVPVSAFSARASRRPDAGAVPLAPSGLAEGAQARAKRRKVRGTVVGAEWARARNAAAVEERGRAGASRSTLCVGTRAGRGRGGGSGEESGEPPEETTERGGTETPQQRVPQQLACAIRGAESA
ncbi:hypothetical protein BESB_029390 [Besnoitia besnoiti]|uniref:Uncharacterized protein n=1 Tax=Besnoitia besnoiti TaxID=94643 RepID=A0A2A9M2R1_BESBE|nr:uncharacterized protein BESB_029390 [Besnoitia besnoiti]PFH31504.1 hypothetical protein BESB_029390 [Besnoitia besnoiti]